MWIVLFAAAALAALPQVQLKPLAGPPVSGQLVSLNAEQIVLEVDGQQKSWQGRDILSLTMAAARPIDAPADLVTVELRDGSRLKTPSYTVQEGTATLLVSGGRPAEVPTQMIRAVRFGNARPDAALEKQWQAILDSQHTADVLVVRRSPTALDQLEGVIFGINENVVEFEYDGQRIPVPRPKLEGLVYYHVAGGQSPEPICRLHTSDGSRWNAASVEFDESSPDVLQVVSGAGLTVVLPLDQVTTVDFSAGNVLYLSDLEPESIHWSSAPTLGASLFQSRMAGALEQLWEPKRDQSFYGGPLLLGGESYEKGLALHSRTELVYRIPAGFRRFQALVGIDDRVRSGGHVRLIISADDRQLLDQEITGSDQPVPLELDLADARRLRILVDFGQQQDVADHLNLCEARITK